MPKQAAVYVLRSDEFLPDEDVSILASSEVRAIQLAMVEFGGVADEWEIVAVHSAGDVQEAEVVGYLERDA